MSFTGGPSWVAEADFCMISGSFFVRPWEVSSWWFLSAQCEASLVYTVYTMYLYVYIYIYVYHTMWCHAISCIFPAWRWRIHCGCWGSRKYCTHKRSQERVHVYWPIASSIDSSYGGSIKRLWRQMLVSDHPNMTYGCTSRWHSAGGRKHENISEGSQRTLPWRLKTEVALG